MLKKFVGFTLLLANIGAVLWLFMCLYASYYDTSATPSYISLFSFTCIFAAFVNALFIGIWLFSKRKAWAILSFLAILVCWRVVKPVFGSNILGNQITESTSKGIKIMTWNVHMFDLGEWTRDNTTTTRILNFISTENPDILCMQEYYRDANNPNEPYTELIMKSGGYGYYSFFKQDEWEKRAMTINASLDEMVEVGTMVFSKFPITDINILTKRSKDYSAQLVKIDLEDDKSFALMNVHLTSVKFGEKEQDYIQDIKSNKGIIKTDDDKAKSKHLAYKLKYASHKRAGVANALKSIREMQTLPVVITGDFNDMPGSYVYHTVKGDLNDAFISKGFGLGRTYNKIFPTLRIDNIFYDAQLFKAEGVKIVPTTLSDHNPIVAFLKIK